MYESPIQLVFDEIVHETQQEIDGIVFRAVQNVGVNVDKEELIKALQYDRGQYEKGYADAIQKTRWIPVSENTPDMDYVTVNGTEYSDVVQTTVVNHGSDDEKFVDMMRVVNGEWRLTQREGESLKLPEWCEVTAWAPLPEPYK